MRKKKHSICHGAVHQEAGGQQMGRKGPKIHGYWGLIRENMLKRMPEHEKNAKNAYPTLFIKVHAEVE